MSTLGSFAKGLAFFLGKQPEEEQRGRGFLGLEWVERVEAGRSEVEISRVLDELAGARRRASVRRPHPQDQPPRDRGHQRCPRRSCRQCKPGDTVAVVVRRGSGTGNHELELTLTVGEGL